MPNQRHSITISEAERRKMKQTRQLLDYLATQEEAALTYNASEMKFAAHSDVSYIR